ncbi:hypothetical protein [Streptomyces sp. NBC_00470]|uniref:hypothetical protein n=1 Tax=Streptomyces sp. NBC_00470 TaxID=2975753 RepID=UPI0030E21F60
MTTSAPVPGPVGQLSLFAPPSPLSVEALTPVAAEARPGVAKEFWIRIAPSGCVTGSVLASFVGLLAEDAHKEFTPRVKKRRQEAAEGWRHELVDRSEWDRRARLCMLGKCQHC